MDTQETNPKAAKPFWRSKTFWLNAIGIALAVLPLMAADPTLAAFIPARVLLLISSILNIVLRFLGGVPLSVKKQPLFKVDETQELKPVSSKKGQKR